MIIRYYRNNEKRRIIFGTIYILATVIVIFLSYSLALKYIYKKSAQSGFTVFIERLKTLSNEKDGVRANAWQNSLKMINAHPFFGIGTGNWKIEVLKYETPATGAYIYAYKNHNDFIETTVDIGIFGGLLFLGIFLFIFANFLRAFFKAKKGEEESYKWLFLPAFGLFCYAFDALFNFPSDRPEIVSFFAIFVGAGIAFSPPSLFVTRHASRVTSSVTRHVSRIYVTRHALRVTLITVFLSLMVGSIYIFYLNFKSLKLQRIAKQELNAGNLTSSSDLFLREFPAIPDINIEGEPISVTIARYLINEGKYQQAIDLLKKDKSSPYDTRQEFFTAMAFLKMGQPDSALVYTHFVYDRKPYFSGNISLMASAYEAKGNFIEAMKVIDEHTQFNNKNGQPVSEIISRQKVNLIPMVKIQPFQVLYNNGMAAFDRKEYSNAVKYFTKFIEQEPGVAKAFEYRAFSYFYLEKYQSSYADINQTIILDLPIKASYLNLRGVILHMLGNDPPACDDFQRAINMGDKDAVNNYEKFCKKK
jgi:tetratricopeptide (TPR) repeat protein